MSETVIVGVTTAILCFINFCLGYWIGGREVRSLMRGTRRGMDALAAGKTRSWDEIKKEKGL